MDRPIRQLDRLGPGSGAAPARGDEAEAYVRALTRSADENFHVLSRFVPEPVRDDVAAVYAFCRWADDLADETHALGLTGEAARAEALRLLAWWRGELDACFAGDPRHPVMVALAGVARRRGLVAQPFHHLIDAFEQDQRVTRYDTWESLLGYCRRSADPVGRIVLALAGCGDGSNGEASTEPQRLSDRVCTGLQLVNFWQDVRRDLVERDRVYIPRDAGVDEPTLRGWLARPEDPAARVPFIALLRGLLERSAPLLDAAPTLAGMVDPAFARMIMLFGAGGRAVAAKIERRGCTTLWQRPRLTKFDKAALLARAWLSARGRAA